jgi:hypothetical protein
MITLFLQKFMEISGWVSWVVFILTILFIIREAIYAKNIKKEK